MRRPLSAIGISMLDLISNALAATLILFFVLSILRQPPIPPERILGTLVVRCSIKPIEQKKLNQTDTAKVEIWLHPQELNLGRKFGEKDIDSLNTIAEAFDPYYGLNYGNILDSVDVSNLPPLAAVYSTSPNERVAIVRNPVKGNWFAGLLYVSHNRLDEHSQKAKAHIEVWFVKSLWATGPRIDILAQDSLFVAPTESFGIPFEIPDWLSKSPY